MTRKLPKASQQWLKSQVTECLTEAKIRIMVGLNEAAEEWLRSALRYAKQLPDTPEHRIMRGHIIDALEAVTWLS